MNASARFDRLCITCKHFVAPKVGGGLLELGSCALFRVKSLVTGEVMQASAGKARETLTMCGPDGKKFERKTR